MLFSLSSPLLFSRSFEYENKALMKINSNLLIFRMTLSGFWGRPEPNSKYSPFMKTEVLDGLSVWKNNTIQLYTYLIIIQYTCIYTYLKNTDKIIYIIKDNVQERTS